MSNDAVVQALVGQLNRLQEQVEKLVSRTVVSNNSAFFSAYATGTTALTGTMGAIALGGIQFNDGNFGTPVANTYRCPVAGHYLFCGAILIQSTAAIYCYASICMAGVEIFRGIEAQVAAAQYLLSTVSVVASCAAGDLITLGGFAAGAGTAQAGASVTYLIGQIQ